MTNDVRATFSLSILGADTTNVVKLVPKHNVPSSKFSVVFQY